MTPDNKRRDEMAKNYVGSCDNESGSFLQHHLEAIRAKAFKAGYDAGREDASFVELEPEARKANADAVKSFFDKDPQPTERRENLKLRIQNEFAYMANKADTNRDRAEFEKIGNMFSDFIREVAAGLIPVEDIVPLLEALEIIEREVETERLIRETEEPGSLNHGITWKNVRYALETLKKALAAFYAKHPQLEGK